MKIFLSISIIFFSVAYAHAQKQGLCGKVVWVSGNQMPGPGLKSSAAKGIVREVYIYEATNTAQTTGENGFYKTVQTKLIKKLKTKKDGRFSVSLPVGTYSVFVKEPNGLWANSFDGEGRINPVIINAKSCTSLTITVNYEAAY